MVEEKVNVLVVEDSPTQAFLLQVSLEEQGMKVEVAADGKEALKKMQGWVPSVIISDIEMPEMDGYAFCRKVKENSAYKTIPVILLTNLSDPMDVIRGIECGCDSFMTKPYEITSLLATMHDARENLRLHGSDQPSKQLDFFFNGQRHCLRTNQEQMTGLLLSIYSSAIQKNIELQEAYRQVNLFSEEVQKKNEELQQLNELKNQFLGIAAHDLRNPLNIIAGYSNVLTTTLEGNVNEKTIKMLDRIKSSSDLMLQLINDLLDSTNGESKTVPLQKTSVDLSALIEENLQILKELTDRKEIRLTFSQHRNIPKIECDSNKVLQIILNLVSEAINNAKKGETIEVSLVPLPSDVQLVVKDEGTVLPDEIKKQIVQQPSQRGISTGASLGLNIVNKIVAEHKGRISIESEAGKGTSYVVTLPLH